MLTPALIFSGDGPLAGLIEDFSCRPQQLALAEAIAQAFSDNQSLICEAGTGTGKTFAYLVPALLSGRKVIISTGTKHLQDQLYLRDLPLVHKALGLPVHVSLLKGRANYLCLHRLALAETENRYFDRQALAQLHDIRTWAQHTEHGDLDELAHIPDGAGIRSHVSSTTDNCLGQECDFFDDCHLFRARRNASDADVVIVNHHLFFADLGLKEQGYGELLPSADMLIFDEAHQLPELASVFFSQTLSGRQILDLVSDAKAAYHKEAADVPELLQILDKLEKASRDLRLAVGPDDLRSDWNEIRERAEVQQAFASLLERGHDLHTALDAFAERGKLLDNCCRRMAVLLNLLDDFESSKSLEQVRWLETRGKGYFLHLTPVDIADSFQSRMNDYDCPSIFTSATLSVSNRFNHFAAQLGLEDVATASWESPFDFSSQALLYLPEFLPDPREPDYTEKMIEKVLPVLELTRGRAFILFTSHRALRLAAELVRDGIDYPVLIQGDAPRTQLLEQFRSAGHAVLLGTNSFWEGVDVKGQALSCVIIDKLPFSSPADPVLKARMKQMEERGGRPFIDYQVPEAVISLKQGIGRLIRDRNDYGLLMICDPRLKIKSYGKIFLNSLPPMSRTTELVDVEDFFARFEQS